MTTRPFTVADVMTGKVVAVRPGSEFKEIVAATERWKVTAAPVVEGEGHVLGAVSEADLRLKEEFHDHRLGLVEQARRLDDTPSPSPMSAGATTASIPSARSVLPISAAIPAVAPCLLP
ncbi:CBS domain-containing protein [Streptomyces zaomyceticus]|uniref:CBS domain-containing protein n=1 Tax=Streptomyces zaomyceticus TaxID=68286 RepID=UPI002E1A1241